MPSSDTYIEKESTINDELDKLRMSATRSLFERRDVIIVASVSCIYGSGFAGGLLRHAGDARARARAQRARRCCGASWTFSTSAARTCGAARSECAAT